MKDEKIISDFQIFLEKENYKYQSEFEKKLKELITISENDKTTSSIKGKVLALQKDSEAALPKLLENDKRDILDLLKEELASRYFGLTGRIKASLDTDLQFQVGLRLLLDQKYYNNFLQRRN